MKVLFYTLILVSTSIFVNAQELLKFENVVKPNSTLTKDDLYNRAHHWVISIFNNPQKVIQLNDKNEGQIICKGGFEYKAVKWWGGGTVNADGYIDFTLKLYFKDGRYKYILSDFIHKPLDGISFGEITNSDKPPMKSHMGSKKRAILIWEDLKSKSKSNAEIIISSLIKEMEKKVSIENDDW